VEEDEPDEVVLVGCSPEHERWLELGARAKKGAKELRRVGKKGWWGPGIIVAFCRGQGSVGEGWSGR
jgi:hypothetical protein